MSQAWAWHCRGWWWRPPSRDAGPGPRPDGNKRVHVSNPYTWHEISPNLCLYHKFCIQMYLFMGSSHFCIFSCDLLRDWKTLQFTEAVQYTNWLCLFQENSRKLKTCLQKKCCTAAQLYNYHKSCLLHVNYWFKQSNSCDISQNVYVVSLIQCFLTLSDPWAFKIKLYLLVTSQHMLYMSLGGFNSQIVLDLRM